MENPYRPFQDDSDTTTATTTHHVQFQEPPVQSTSDDRKVVRLRAIETEAEIYLKTMNVTYLRRLAITELGATAGVFLSQILLYVLASGGGRYFRPAEFFGVGIWTPLFFTTAAGLTWFSTKRPSGCIIGTALGFQIASILAGSILLLFSVISLMMHGRYDYEKQAYDPESPGRFCCSLMIFCGGVATVTANFSCILFYRSICGGRQRALEGATYDVIITK